MSLTKKKYAVGGYANTLCVKIFAGIPKPCPKTVLLFSVAYVTNQNSPTSRPEADTVYVKRIIIVVCPNAFERDKVGSHLKLYPTSLKINHCFTFPRFFTA